MADVKKGDTVVLAGTKKGLFILHSRDRKKWKAKGPYHKGYEIFHSLLDPEEGKTIYTGLTHYQWGARVERTANFGDKWQKGKDGPHFTKKSGLSVTRIWQLARGADGALYAGVEPAGLFRSTDSGDSWQSVDGFNYRADRKDWEPGNGGLCMHTVLPYPRNPKKMVVAISSVGIFGTKDGGKKWKVINGGINGVFAPDKVMKDGEIGTCPHKVVRDAKNPRALYQQNHAGVYRRMEGDDKWVESESGLPRTRKEGKRRWTFGFAAAAHPNEAGTAYIAPLEGDYNRVSIDGAMAIYRTQNGGKSWNKLTKGLPQTGAYFTILRDGMRTDTNDPAGVYVGTTTGQIFASRNDGDSWEKMADFLPPVLSVEAGVVGGR